MKLSSFSQFGESDHAQVEELMSKLTCSTLMAKPATWFVAYDYICDCLLQTQVWLWWDILKIKWFFSVFLNLKG